MEVAMKFLTYEFDNIIETGVLKNGVSKTRNAIHWMKLTGIEFDE